MNCEHSKQQKAGKLRPNAHLHCKLAAICIIVRICTRRLVRSKPRSAIYSYINIRMLLHSTRQRQLCTDTEIDLYLLYCGQPGPVERRQRKALFVLRRHVIFHLVVEATFLCWRHVILLCLKDERLHQWTIATERHSMAIQTNTYFACRQLNNDKRQLSLFYFCEKVRIGQMIMALTVVALTFNTSRFWK